MIGRDEAEVEQRLAQIRARMAPLLPDERLEPTIEMLRTGPLVGTPERIVQRLQELEAVGMTYAITYFCEAAYDTSGIQLFTEQVIPAFAD